MNEKIRGGLYGLLVGDALGVPYEFTEASEIPGFYEIDMEPPKWFHRTYEGLPPGTWSDDGAQALCLLDSLIECGGFNLQNFSEKLSKWRSDGLWAVDGNVFDIGAQTEEALYAFEKGVPPEQCGFVRPNGKGCGALVRVLPLALWHKGADAELVQDAHQQCLITHGNICNQVCCAFYCLLARGLLNGETVQKALESAQTSLCEIYLGKPEYSSAFTSRVLPDGNWEGHGSGYVVDMLHGAVMILLEAGSYEEAVKLAIQLGDDTDSTAAVTGGLAGILFGEDGIPDRWLKELRDRGKVEAILNSLKN